MSFGSFTRTRQALTAFGAANQGVVAIEFAVVAMPFLLLLSAILVISLMMFTTSTLDYATQKAARQVMVGSVQNASPTQGQFITNNLCTLLPPAMFDCSKVVVNLKTIVSSGEPTAYINFVKPDYSAIIVPSATVQGSFCPGGAGDYEVLEVLYPMPLYLSVFSTSSRVVNGKFVLMSTATFRNEPFQGSPVSYPGC